MISTDYITLSSNLKKISFLNLSCILPPVKGFTFSLTFNVINAMTMSNWLSIEKVFHKTHKVLANLDFFFQPNLVQKSKLAVQKNPVTFCKKKKCSTCMLFFFIVIYIFSPRIWCKKCVFIVLDNRNFLIGFMIF